MCFQNDEVRLTWCQGRGNAVACTLQRFAFEAGARTDVCRSESYIAARKMT